MIKFVKKHEWDRLAERLDRIEQQLANGPDYVWYSQEPESDNCHFIGLSPYSVTYKNSISLNSLVDLIMGCLSIKIVPPSKTGLSIVKTDGDEND